MGGEINCGMMENMKQHLEMVWSHGEKGKNEVMKEAYKIRINALGVIGWLPLYCGRIECWSI